MSWLDRKTAEEWRAEGKRYAADVNEYVRIGMETNWQEEPPAIEEDRRQAMAQEVVKMIAAANEAGETALLREELPPASWPLTGEFKEETQAVKPVYAWEDGHVLLQTGASWERRLAYVVGSDSITELTGIGCAGSSVDGQYLAVADENGVRTIFSPDTSLNGQLVAKFRWQDICSRLKADLKDLESLADEERPYDILDEIIPFNDGRQVLLVSAYGIYLLGDSKAQLMHPDAGELREDELEDTRIDMAHGAISRDGRWLAYGSQSSEHLLMDLEGKQLYRIEPHSSYPHYSLFTQDGRSVWFNACHFYNGDTISVPLHAVETGTFAEGLPINEEMRVYAGVALKEGGILGDAYGYLRYINYEGKEIWRYFVGSTISGLIATPDENFLLVGTYGGMLHRINLASGVRDEYSIGTAPICETNRWIFWKNSEPLSW